jgi:peptidoglycan/LPS O-acetylase OafA/YrhL
MDIAIPAAPAGILTLLAFFSPYAIGALNGVLPFVKTAWQRKIVSVLFAIALAALVVVFYQNITGEPVGNIWVFLLLSVVIVSASYALITRGTAKAVERKTDRSLPDPSTATREQYQDALDGNSDR